MILSRLAAPGFIAAFALASCTLPGTGAPTPFTTFPTPHLTLTAVFAPTLTHTPPPPTLVPLETSASGDPTSTQPPTSTQSPSSSSRPNGAPITASRVDSPPIIDGNLDEWTSNAFNVGQVVFGAGQWSGAADLSATMYASWDNANLYFAVGVNDDTFVQNATGMDMFKGDSVEIQLDAELAQDFNSISLSADDIQIGLSPGDFNSHSSESYRWYPTSVSGQLTSIEIGSLQTSSGYNLEARIPWSALGVSPGDGVRFGFALSLSDNDLVGTSIQQTMVSNVTTRTLNDPTSWGTLVLADN